MTHESGWWRRGNVRDQRAAFTLIELVAVLTVSALLVALCVPALAGARRNGRLVRCAANLMALGHASHIYAAQDPNELIIPIHPLAGSGEDTRTSGVSEWGGKAGGGVPYGSPLLSVYSTSQHRGPSTRPLNRIVYGDVFPDNFEAGADPPHDPWLADFNLDLPEFRCPSDAGFTGGRILESGESAGFRSSGMTAYDYFGNSYRASPQLLGIAGGGCTLFTSGPMYRPLSRIPSPTLTILYSEYPARESALMNYSCASPFPGDLQCDTGYGNSCAYLNPPIEFDYPVHGWHGQESMFNVIFIDGHVDYVSMRGMLRPTPDLGRYPPLAGNPGSGFLYGCVITRNVGWQLEVFPAPPLDTGLPCAGDDGGGHDMIQMNP